MSEFMGTPEYVEIMAHFDSLYFTRSQMLSAGMEPSAVVLPARLNKTYDGPGATDHEATMFGLPVQWTEGEFWGIAIGGRR
jgi:hypothetical protein